jgi:kumamolisin
MSSPGSRVNPDQEIVATIVVRRPPEAAGIGEKLLSGEYQPTGREEAERAITASPQDMSTIRQFAAEHGMRIVNENAAARTVRVAGTVQQMESIFGVRIQQRRDDAGHEYLGYEGEIQMPESLTGIVEAVLGLDQRPVARSRPHGRNDTAQ